MPNTMKALEAERDRLHGKAYSGIVVIIDTTRMQLKIKDSRSTERGANPTDVNQAWLKHRVTPGAWRTYDLAESRETFV
jgi:hypothetical protein